MKRDESGAFVADTTYEVSVWFERDRKNVELRTGRGRVIFDLWDDDVDQAIDDGFLVPPRHPRPTEAMWLQPAIDYARDMGLID